jgi:predicted small lipoprotein YifL
MMVGDKASEEWAVGLFDRSAVVRAALAGVLIAAFALSACGRRGPLEPPPNAAAVTDDERAAAIEKDPNAGKPERSFILDPLVR